MKSNFVVSAFREIWLPESRRIFAVDPYIEHVLEREGLRSAYEQIEVAPLTRTTRETLEADHDYVDAKFKKYTELLVTRLDEVQGTQLGPGFWRKAMALSLLRHVTFCFDLYQLCEANLDLDLHDCRILDASSYRIPFDFDEHRQIFQNTELGQEQLFSIYCQMFYPGRFVTWQAPQRQAEDATPLAVPAKVDGFLVGVCNKILRNIKVLCQKPGDTLRVLASKALRIRRPRLGIMACSFAQEHVDRLQFGSLGRIQTIDLPVITAGAGHLDWDLRELLVREEANFDRFDRFVFACLRHGMPRIFVEDFGKAYQELSDHLQRYRGLPWVVCEWWIGQNIPAFALAVMQQSGTKHIYNEHNYLSHFFVGSNLKYLAPLVDEFVTLGWEDRAIPNLVRGASLFPWVETNVNGKKEHEILLVAGLPVAHAPEITSAYADFRGYGAIAYLELNRRFMERMDRDLLGKIYFRSYPMAASRDWLVWDQAFELSRYVRNVRKFDDSSISGRVLMQRSRLVVVNYLSTAYLESLIADIPTVFLWNQHTYYFSEQYQHIFDDLIKVGICQTDPEEAADFIQEICRNPESWWGREDVQRARKKFLQENIGDAEKMFGYLTDKIH